MKTLESLLTDEMKDAIVEYNACSKLNSFLYHNQICEDLFKKFTGKDRMGALVNRCNQLSRELTVVVNILFHNKRVGILTVDQSTPIREGIIHHPITREFEARTLDNEVSFRNNEGDNMETIAVWVNAGDQFTSHLYPITRLIIIE